MVVAANVYEDHDFGDSTRLYEFVKNCNLGAAISETAMHKVFDYYWKRLKNKSFSKDGWFKIGKLNDFFSSMNEITRFIERFVSKALTAGIIESQTTYKGMDFYYDLNVHFKNQLKFDLSGGNKLKVYNMAFDFSVRIAAYCTVENNVRWLNGKHYVCGVKKQGKNEMYHLFYLGCSQLAFHSRDTAVTQGRG